MGALVVSVQVAWDPCCCTRFSRKSGEGKLWLGVGSACICTHGSHLSLQALQCLACMLLLLGLVPGMGCSVFASALRMGNCDAVLLCNIVGRWMQHGLVARCLRKQF